MKWPKVVVAVAIVAGLWFGRSMLLPTEESVPAESETPAVSSQMTRVHALGRLEPRGSVLRVVPMSGNEGARVSRLLVQEGQQVDAGQLLCVMDGFTRREAAVQEAMANLAVAKGRLSQVLAGAKKGDIEAAKAAYEQAVAQQKLAVRTFERAATLQKSRATSRQQYDDAKSAYDRAVLEVTRRKGIYEALSEVREIDVNLERSNVKVAEARLASAEADLSAANVLAPASGTVLRIHTRPGEKPQETGLLEIGDIDHMQVVAEVYEGDVSKLRSGMSVSFRVESLSEILHGTVAEIGTVVSRKVVLTNDPVSDTDARVVEVRIDIDPNDINSVRRLSNARVGVDFDLSKIADGAGDESEMSVLP